MFTGERIDPRNILWRAHRLRTTKAYEFALSRSHGKRVLDIGCGEGYGAALLTNAASAVIGIDKSLKTIRRARCFYRSNKTFFAPGEADHLPIRSFSMDLILAVQVLEHVKDIDTVLSGAKRALSPTGVFICSTPNRLSSLYDVDPFHFHAFDPEGLKIILKKYFSSCELYGIFGSGEFMRLKRAEHEYGAKLLTLDQIGLRRIFPRRLQTLPFSIVFRRVLKRVMNEHRSIFEDLSTGDLTINTGNIESSLDLIAVCAS